MLKFDDVRAIKVLKKIFLMSKKIVGALAKLCFDNLNESNLLLKQHFHRIHNLSMKPRTQNHRNQAFT